MDKEQKLRYKRFREAFDYLKNIGRISNQKDLADILHKTPETISRIMAGSGNNPTEKFMFFFAKAFSQDVNEEYIMNGTGELVGYNPESKQYKLGDQHYIESLEEQLKKTESEVLFYRQQIAIKDEQYKDLRKDNERLYSLIESLTQQQGKREDLANTG